MRKNNKEDRLNEVILALENLGPSGGSAAHLRSINVPLEEKYEYYGDMIQKAIDFLEEYDEILKV